MRDADLRAAFSALWLVGKGLRAPPVAMLADACPNLPPRGDGGTACGITGANMMAHPALSCLSRSVVSGIRAAPTIAPAAEGVLASFTASWQVSRNCRASTAYTQGCARRQLIACERRCITAWAQQRRHAM